MRQQVFKYIYVLNHSYKRTKLLKHELAPPKKYSNEKTSFNRKKKKVIILL